MMLGVPNAMQAGWKMFRGGKATQMASDGDELAKILDAGEWRSRSFLNYTDLNVINATRFLADHRYSAKPDGLPPGTPRGQDL